MFVVAAALSEEEESGYRKPEGKDKRTTEARTTRNDRDELSKISQESQVNKVAA